ncbi:MAG: spermidine synthase [Actinomycetota bacterium]
MSTRFKELDWQQTPTGEISLRRRREPTLGVDVYEVKLGEEFLMSSLFTVGEEELARIGLGLAPNGIIDVVVGGLGLGFTARSALADPRVGSLVVVDAIEEVVDWHREGLVPGGRELSEDPRTRFMVGDFFALAEAPAGFDPDAPGRKYQAILVDIDHSPRHVLSAPNAGFYTPDGLWRLAGHLTDGGVFALWSDDPPDDDFLTTLCTVFPDGTAHVVEFPNFLTGGTSANTIYTGTRS